MKRNALFVLLLPLVFSCGMPIAEETRAEIPRVVGTIRLPDGSPVPGDIVFMRGTGPLNEKWGCYDAYDEVYRAQVEPYFTISDVPPGVYDVVKVEHFGVHWDVCYWPGIGEDALYLYRALPVTVREGETVSLYFTLQRANGT
jgi:hypothetical protein